jgi:hypothetical protein
LTGSAGHIFGAIAFCDGGFGAAETVGWVSTGEITATAIRDATLSA